MAADEKPPTDETEKTDNLPIPKEVQQQVIEPILAIVPEERREEVRRIFRLTSVYHSGPLPDPRTLERYNKLIPKGAERLMQLVEQEAAHRHAQETCLVKVHEKLSLRGQWIALMLTVFLVAVALYLATRGMAALAGVIFTTTIVAVCTVFVIGRKEQSKSETD